MTVSTEVDHNDYTGNGVTTVFPYQFRIFKNADLTVTVIDTAENATVLILDTDYTVTGAGGYVGGNVTLASPLANGYQISIARNLAVTQETDLRNQGSFFAEVHEDAFDKLTMLIQQVRSLFTLSLRKPSSIANWYDALNNYIRNLRDPSQPQDAATKNYVDNLSASNFGRTLRVPEPINSLPSVAIRRNTMPAFDNDGNAIVVVPPSGSASDVLIQLASSADGKGDELITVKQPFPGSMSTTVHQKMREIIAINDGSSSGAEPDGVTDCSSALLGLVSTVNPVVRLPFIPGTANVYYFSTFDPDSLQGVTFDVDSGVKLSVPNDWLAGKPSALNIKFVRTTRFIFRSISTEYTVTSGNNEAYSAKTVFLENSSFDNSTASSINVLTDTSPLKILWPSSDSWVSDSYAANAEDYGQFSVASGDNYFHVGVVDVIPGDELSTTMYVTNTPQLCAVVRHTGGYSGLFASYAQTGATAQAFEKRQGITGTSVAVSYPMLADHKSYSPVNCEWKIRINNFTSFDVLLNGFVITTITTPGFIIDAGFGGFFNAGLVNPAVRFLNPVKIKNNGYTRNSFMAVKIFGDSISADRVDCWPHYLKKELEFAEGVRAWSIINKAVPGDTSSGQLAIMQSVGVADANVVVIAVGTNDAQGLLDLDQYKSNLSAMVTIAQNAGKPVILVKFGLWYPQALAGAGVGQNTGNYEFAARYRSVVSRVAAEKNVKLVELTDCEGPLVAYYVNSSLSVNMVGAGDGVVHDNIHPTSMATMLIARKIARAIMGSFTYSRGMLISGMGAIVAMNNWLINTSDRPVLIDVSGDGVVILSGIVFKNTGSIANGTIIAQCPKNMSPKHNIRASVYADTTGVNIEILPTGEIKIYGATSSTNFVSLAGISWLIK